MTGTQQEEIRNLRTLNLTPKQIAQKLGIKVSEVNAGIQNQA
jgi:DNA-binding CsgD family transcriptional regulator